MIDMRMRYASSPSQLGSGLGTPRSGQCSATYLSAASLRIHDVETFFCFASASNVLYTSGGKLTEARTARGRPLEGRPAFFLGVTAVCAASELDAALYTTVLQISTRLEAA